MLQRPRAVQDDPVLQRQGTELQRREQVCANGLAHRDWHIGLV
ncbi:hypothetical protein [Cupriavidus alkaliphilus]|nr:hypothetical protein [Cupriavidus alkaliphilus]